MKDEASQLGECITGRQSEFRTIRTPYVIASNNMCVSYLHDWVFNISSISFQGCD